MAYFKGGYFQNLQRIFPEIDLDENKFRAFSGQRK